MNDDALWCMACARTSARCSTLEQLRQRWMEQRTAQHHQGVRGVRREVEADGRTAEKCPVHS